VREIIKRDLDERSSLNIFHPDGVEGDIAQLHRAELVDAIKSLRLL
jgi:hypothetical protein